MVTTLKDISYLCDFPVESIFITELISEFCHLFTSFLALILIFRTLYSLALLPQLCVIMYLPVCPYLLMLS